MVYWDHRQWWLTSRFRSTVSIFRQWQIPAHVCTWRMHHWDSFGMCTSIFFLAYLLYHPLVFLEPVCLFKSLIFCTYLYSKMTFRLDGPGETFFLYVKNLQSLLIRRKWHDQESITERYIVCGRGKYWQSPTDLFKKDQPLHNTTWGSGIPDSCRCGLWLPDLGANAAVDGSRSKDQERQSFQNFFRREPKIITDNHNHHHD